MKLLVVAGEAITPDQLRQAAGSDADPGAAEVMVLAPALAESGLRFWMSDADEAIARAQQVGADSVSALAEEGLSARQKTGEADPEVAIADALQTFPADRIVIFTSAGAGRYREELDAEKLQERYSRPVTVVQS